jgi:hypothetical protein
MDGFAQKNLSLVSFGLTDKELDLFYDAENTKILRYKE